MNKAHYLYDLDLDELTTLLKSWGEPGYRARQIWQGLYQNLWRTPEEFTTLPLKLRQRLAEQVEFSRLKAVSELKSSDRETLKILFHLPDGKPIEPYECAIRNGARFASPPNRAAPWDVLSAPQDKWAFCAISLAGKSSNKSFTSPGGWPSKMNV